MIDREKVIKALECAIDENHYGFKRCHDCDYRKDIDHFQYVCDGDKCIADAIALLKAQEPIAPIRRSAHAQGADDVWYECGNCGEFLSVNRYSTKQFCAKCGRAVKWE